MAQEAALNRCPELHELDLIEYKGKKVRVLEESAGKWNKLAIRLHFKGNKITQIQNDSGQNSYQACQSVFSEWLDGKEGLRLPRTWVTVIAALGEADLGQLAEKLKEVLLLSVPDSTPGRGASKDDLPKNNSSTDRESKSPHLTIENLAQVYKEVSDVRAKWYNFCLELELPASDLDAIKEGQHGDPDACLREALKIFLRKVQPRPTWKRIVNALESPTIHYESLAEEIKKKFNTE